MMNVYEMHAKVFGVEPIVIGLYWSDVNERIAKAIETGKPYNEREMADPELLKAYDAGDIVF